MQATAASLPYANNDVSTQQSYSEDDQIFNRYTAPVAYRTASLASTPQIQFNEPAYIPKRKQAPLITRVNKVVRSATIALWSLAILGYGLDVSASNEVGRLQDRARRLNEQNMELSARVLKAISFQGIQDRALGQLSLVVPEQVLIVKEVPPYQIPGFHPQKHHLPLLPGF